LNFVVDARKMGAKLVPAMQISLILPPAKQYAHAIQDIIVQKIYARNVQMISVKNASIIYAPSVL